MIIQVKLMNYLCTFKKPAIRRTPAFDFYLKHADINTGHVVDDLLGDKGL